MRGRRMRANNLIGGHAHVFVASMKAMVRRASASRCAKSVPIRRHTPATREANLPRGRRSTILPPSVPRFCVAMLPVSRAARHSSGNSPRKTAMLLNFRVSGQRAQGNGIRRLPRCRASHPDCQTLKKRLCESFPASKKHHQVGAAGEGLPISGLRAVPAPRPDFAARRSS